MASKRRRKVVDRKIIERQRRDRLVAVRRREDEQRRVKEAEMATRMLSQEGSDA